MGETVNVFLPKVVPPQTVIVSTGGRVVSREKKQQVVATRGWLEQRGVGVGRGGRRIVCHRGAEEVVIDREGFGVEAQETVIRQKDRATVLPTFEGHGFNSPTVLVESAREPLADGYWRKIVAPRAVKCLASGGMVAFSLTEDPETNRKSIDPNMIFLSRGAYQKIKKDGIKARCPISVGGVKFITVTVPKVLGTAVKEVALFPDKDLKEVSELLEGADQAPFFRLRGTSSLSEVRRGGSEHLLTCVSQGECIGEATDNSGNKVLVSSRGAKEDSLQVTLPETKDICEVNFEPGGGAKTLANIFGLLKSLSGHEVSGHDISIEGIVPAWPKGEEEAVFDQVVSSLFVICDGVSMDSLPETAVRISGANWRAVARRELEPHLPASGDFGLKFSLTINEKGEMVDGGDQEDDKIKRLEAPCLVSVRTDGWGPLTLANLKEGSAPFVQMDTPLERGHENSVVKVAAMGRVPVTDRLCWPITRRDVRRDVLAFRRHFLLPMPIIPVEIALDPKSGGEEVDIREGRDVPYLFSLSMALVTAGIDDITRFVSKRRGPYYKEDVITFIQAMFAEYGQTVLKRTIGLKEMDITAKDLRTRPDLMDIVSEIFTERLNRVRGLNLFGLGALSGEVGAEDMTVKEVAAYEQGVELDSLSGVIEKLTGETPSAETLSRLAMAIVSESSMTVLGSGDSGALPVPGLTGKSKD